MPSSPRRSSSTNTTFGALHAGLAVTSDDPVPSSERADDAVGLDRHPLD
jgi:hypothetical protein